MRVQVSLSDTMVENVDKYAKLMGVSRSALCSMLVGQGIMGFEKSMEVMNRIGDNLSDSLKASTCKTKKK